MIIKPTLLREEHMWGDDRFPEFTNDEARRIGNTDLAILLGGMVDSSHKDKDGRRCGASWAASADDAEDVRIVRRSGDRDYDCPRSRGIAARPALPKSEIEKIVAAAGGDLGRNFFYGEYPQVAVDEETTEYLNKFSDKLLPTGKSYTFDDVGIDYDTNNRTPFKAKQHQELAYDGNIKALQGRKFIKVQAKKADDDSVLQNGDEIRDGREYWVEVTPVEWKRIELPRGHAHYDEWNGGAYATTNLFAGIQFDQEKTDFNQDPFIKEYLEKVFAKEMLAGQELEKLQPKQLSRQGRPRRDNPYRFDFGQVSEEDIIRGAIQSDVAVYLHGKSGDGKTGRVKQLDPDAEVISLFNATPDSLNGKSVYDPTIGEMRDVKPKWLKRVEEMAAKNPDKVHIVFFDELANCTPAMQKYGFNIVLEKRVNDEWELPSNVRIVAAGNEKEESMAANELVAPLFNRFAHVYIETKPNDFLQWGAKKANDRGEKLPVENYEREFNLHPAVYAFIASKGTEAGSVMRSKYTGEKPNADPRKWEMASKMLYATGKPEMLRALIGEEITREFVAFCQQEIVTLKDVLAGEYSARDLEMNAAQKYATAITMTQVGEENLQQVWDFIGHFDPEIKRHFIDMWTGGDERRQERLYDLADPAELPEFTPSELKFIQQEQAQAATDQSESGGVLNGLKNLVGRKKEQEKGGIEQ